MSADQRRAQIGKVTGSYVVYPAGDHPALASRTPASEPDMPHLSNYLTQLKEPAQQAAKSEKWWKMFSKKAKSMPVEPEVGVKDAPSIRPIGDRRTRSRSRRSDKTSDTPRHSGISLAIWGYYFIAKLGLFGMGLIDFHALENLLFAGFILLPVLRRTKLFVVPVLAAVMLYYDSWLPPISRLFAQASELSSFSLPYLFELAGRFFSWHAVGFILVCSAAYWVVSRWIRMSVLVLAGMAVIALVQGYSLISTSNQEKPDMNAYLNDFFAKEAQRSVSFTTPQPDATPFDVIFIHVCSLSWDDVQAVGLDQHPLWKRFDFLFTNFNSAASYSGPAAIHLLRAKCGQPQHGSMYLPTEDKCYLMSSLGQSGFEIDMALNHDGKFDNFLGQLRADGNLDAPPLPLDGLEPEQYAFDDSPVYDDLSVLDRWLENRQKSTSRRVALYYNTVSMHDGNHPPGTHSSSRTMDTYKARLGKFLDEMDGFMQKLDQSGRRAVVVMVPEHGGAVRGDKRQIAGLREIPTPAITIVPVGIKVVGAHREGQTQLIDLQTSYLAISTIVERMLEQSPFDGNDFNPADYVKDLPITPFVAQNEKATVAEYKNHFYYTRGDGKWEHYSEFDNRTKPLE